jgi:pyruvate dehydrogenase E2 component (dihydrolipoamide acetyltransferase)
MSLFRFVPAEPQIASTVTRWLKSAGDAFAAGDALVELETETATIVIEAPAAGKLAAILAKPGQTVKSGADLARFETTTPAAANSSAPAAPTSTEKAVSQTQPTPGGKVTPILMPQAGNTMEEGTVLEWRVKEGDTIAVGQILCEIETDKATMEFESPDAGRLAKIVAKIGDPVAVKEPIALLAESDADVAAYLAGASGGAAVEAKPQAAGAPAEMAAKASNRVAAPAVVGDGGRVKASPAARKVAAERGVALALVGAGSGPGGRILSTDIRDLPQSIGNGAAAAASAGEIRRPLSKMRRAIGLNLQQSKQTVPHFYVRTTIDADPLLAFYREQKTTTGCSLNDLVIMAVGRAIAEFPALRSQIVGNEIVEFPHANIGIAVGVDEGLVVPVVLTVDTLSLADLAKETKRVVENGRKGKLENIGKGHFTISNLGMFGVEEFSAIINPPESGILAVSAAREAVIVENGAMRAGRSMTMTLSADHRLVDGVMAAKFMQRLKDLLEHPLGEQGKLA